MADEVNLVAESDRIAGSRQARRIRRAGGVPAIVYGHGADPLAVTVDHHDLVGALSTAAGGNALINLKLGGDSVLTMPRVVERHPYRNEIRHVDFIRVSLTETVVTNVAVHLVGEAVGIETQDGVLSQPHHSLSIEALATGIPNAIEVDISELSVGDVIRVADLPVLPGVIYLDDPEEVVVSVTVPAAEEPEEEEEEVEGDEAAVAGGQTTPEV